MKRGFVFALLMVPMTLCVSARAEDESGAQGGSAIAPIHEMGDVSGDSEADLEVARLHFSNGVNLLQDDPPNYQDAWQQFRLALIKSGYSWKVRGNLGYCALKLERDGEALEHYRIYLKDGGDEINPRERADIERELLLLEGNMSWVTLTSNEPDVDLAVSRDGSTAPTQAYVIEDKEAKLGLRAGDFTIVAKKGGQTLTWEPLLTPGKNVEHFFDFSDKGAADQKVVPLRDQKQPFRPNTLQWAGFGSLGGGVALGIAGIVTGALAKSKESQAKENCIDQVCPGSDASVRDSARHLATATNVLFIAGGILAATGVTLVIVGEQRKRQPDVGLRLAPTLSYGGGGLALWGVY